MKRDALIDLLSGWAKLFQMTGSRYICNPAPTGTDEDYIALINMGDFDPIVNAGFQLNTDTELYDGCPDFYAFRLEEFNVICVEDEIMYGRWVDATEQAKAQNLLQKADRIQLFQRVLYGVEEAPEVIFP